MNYIKLAECPFRSTSVREDKLHFDYMKNKPFQPNLEELGEYDKDFIGKVLNSKLEDAERLFLATFIVELIDAREKKDKVFRDFEDAVVDTVGQKVYNDIVHKACARGITREMQKVLRNAQNGCKFDEK